MSIFSRTDVTAVKFYEDYVLAGIGGAIYSYKKDTTELIESYNNILQGQKIYGIIPHDDKSKLLIFGGKQFKIIQRLKEGSSLFDFSPGSVVCDDWLHCGIWLSDENIALLTAHNVVQIWNVSNKPVLISQTINKNNSILYSGLILPLTDDVLVFSGTVFSEVIISRCKNEKELHCLTGHKGVIFSISCSLQKGVIVTTSDDRSLRVWTLNGPSKNRDSAKFWDSVTISCIHELYGHSARVMRSCISDEYILSVGEDSLVCFWNYGGKMVRRVDVHQNAPIWSVDVDDTHFVTGGGDCGVTLQTLSVASDYSHSERVEIGKSTPKQLVFTARRNIILLTESTGLIYYDITTKSETVHPLQFDSTYIMMSMSQCRQIISIADMNANLKVFVEVCKGSPNIQNVIRTKMQIDRVLSMHWGGNRHLMFCSESGELYLVASKQDDVEIIRKFSLPLCKERWLTSVAMNENNDLLVVGDRCGNIHCYVKRDFNPNPIKTFTKVHGRYGPTSIRVKNDEIITTGRDGTLKYFSVFCKDGIYRIKPTRSQEAGFQWVEKCIDPEGNFICGFQERVFVISDLRSNSKIIEVTCGGGHRSWDVLRFIEKIDETYEELIKLIYLKNSDVNIETFRISKILPIDIIKGTHSKEINCLKSHITKLDESTIFFITGGEDTTLRISACSKSLHFRDQIVLKQLSNIRTLRLCDLEDDKVLLISGGGRAQICVRRIVFHRDNDGVKVIVEDLVDYLVKGTDKERKGDKTWRNCTVDFDPETRIMDLEIIKVDEENFVIYAGCSDAYIRVFQLKCSENEVEFKPIGQLSHHKTCILKTHSVKFLERIILITCSTRGEICLWDVTDEKCCSQKKPLLVFNANKSGINCISSKVVSNTELLIATGGDDNAAHLNRIIFTDDDLQTATAATVWTSDKLHCSQITGIILTEDFLVSTSIDQRVTILRFKDDGSDVNLHQVITDVADVQGIDVVRKSNEILTVCVFGKGLQTLALPMT